MAIATQGKWEKLNEILRDVIIENMKKPKHLQLSASQIAVEFSKNHDTTRTSVLTHYYPLKKQIDEDFYASIERLEKRKANEQKEIEFEEVKNEEYVDDDEHDSVNEFEVDKEKDTIVDFLSFHSNNHVSDEAITNIESMINEYGVVKTTLTLVESIKDFGNIDVSTLITKDALKRLK